MPGHPDAVNQSLEEFRTYLETLRFIRIDPRLRSKFGMSDIVQKTLWEASNDLERVLAMDADGRKRWLCCALVNNLRDEVRRWRGPEHDVARERPLEPDAAESWRRLNDWIEADDTSPSGRAAREEDGLRLLDALSKLDPRQREALILQKYHGWTLAQIAEHMHCTTGVVAGLHARGLKDLRKHLPEME
jgi:RNA polymerase sigma-70 factor (subfamily 1)